MHYRDKEEKLTIGMIITGIIIIAILLTSLIVYLLNINSTNLSDGVIKNEALSKASDDKNLFEDVSTEIGKTVNESLNELIDNNSTNNNSITNTVINNTIDTNKTSNNSEKSTNHSKNLNTNNTISTLDNEKKVNNIKETTSTLTNKDKKNDSESVKFTEPVKGEIIREFAPDSLVYSETLKEWVTHNGVDIKADKANVVVSACDGKVSAIKNDPRYGLTVIIEHNNGYKTVYANLLTAEYIIQGEDVTAGQTIGTIGNSANFEIADDYHLHFEVLKDGEYIDPVTIW